MNPNRKRNSKMRQSLRDMAVAQSILQSIKENMGNRSQYTWEEYPVVTASHDREYATVWRKAWHQYWLNKLA